MRTSAPVVPRARHQVVYRIASSLYIENCSRCFHLITKTSDCLSSEVYYTLLLVKMTQISFVGTRIILPLKNACYYYAANLKDFIFRGKFVYATRGRRLCSKSFAKLTGINKHNKSGHTRQIGTAEVFQTNNTKLLGSNKDSISLQRWTDGSRNDAGKTWDITMD